jgi:pimeloyl-ACP methyl ester carboxylesterase
MTSAPDAPTAPEWFTAALAVPREQRTVTVEGCPINTLRWGERGRPGLVLVHGGAAHAEWWSFIAPQLAQQYDVVALDMSGHGESGRREEYPREQWAREVVAVAADAGFPGPPVLVGHSLGGLVSIVAASLYGDRLAGAVIVDSPVRAPDPESEEGARGRAFRNPKTYPDLEKAITHFHLVPPAAGPARLHPASRRDAVAPEDARGLVLEVRPARLHPLLAEADERLPGGRAQSRRALPRRALVPGAAGDRRVHVRAPVPERSIVAIPQAHHHVILDQPLAFVAALRAILADWEHSVPRKPRKDA